MSTQNMIELIRDYFKTQPVLKVWLFGSYTRGEETHVSDVDLLERLHIDLQKLLEIVILVRHGIKL